MADSYYGTGRRKTSIARATLMAGTGKITINERDISDYFGTDALKKAVNTPLQLTAMEGKFDVRADVKGGGVYGQADAMKLAIARALIKYDQNLLSPLSKASCLTRDPREKERQKYGQKGARAKNQYSKR